MRWNSVVLGAFFLASGALGSPALAEAAGPWKAQVVDAETEKPLEGVVVLAVWFKMIRTPGGPSPKFYDAEEMVTGPDGRFTIASRWMFTLNPFTYIDGPEFFILKPNYGEWRVRAAPPDWEEMIVAELFAQQDVVIGLLPLKTCEEWRKFYRSPSRWSPPAPVPPDRTKRLDEAIEIMERAYRDSCKE